MLVALLNTDIEQGPYHPTASICGLHFPWNEKDQAIQLVCIFIPLVPRLDKVVKKLTDASQQKFSKEEKLWNLKLAE